MEKINGFIISGKVYVADPIYSRCSKCELQGKCKKDYVDNLRTQMCNYLGAGTDNDFGFRYSPSLTERLNNSKTKEE